MRGFRGAYSGDVLDLTLAGVDPSAVARRIAQARPEAVVAVGVRAALFARDRLPRTPVVFCAVQNYESHGLTGAWITGVSTEVPPEDELHALRVAAPAVRRVGILYGKQSGTRLRRQARAAAQAQGLTITEAPLGNLSELPNVVRQLAGSVDAFWMPADTAVATPEAFSFLLRFSLEQQKPLLVFSDALVRAGALTGVSPDFTRAGERAAEAVRRILAGERPADVPVTHVRTSRIVVNSATARAIGLELSADVRSQAEMVP